MASFLAKVRSEPGWEHVTGTTTFDIIDQSEERAPPSR
jgi:hypothetical protein